MADAVGQLVLNQGVNILLDRGFKTSPTLTAMTKFGVGTGAEEPTVADTALDTQVAINGGNWKDNTSTTINTGSNYALIQSVLAFSEANGNTIKEYGLANTDGTPLLGIRVVFSITGQSKTAAEQLVLLTKAERET